jgi:hypothetical protein
MPVQRDSAGQLYYDGDNIRITFKDLEWITRPKVELPKEADRPITSRPARIRKAK